MTTQTETITPSSSHAAAQKKPWQQYPRRPSFHSSHSRPDPEEVQRLSEYVTRQTTTTRSSNRRVAKWYQVRWFKGIKDDIKRRAPYYWSDWTDAWDYRVIPATVYMYFAKYARLRIHISFTRNHYKREFSVSESFLACPVNPFHEMRPSQAPRLTFPDQPSILPALAFSLDMFTKTHNSFGVNEVLLSSVLACGVFSLFACQPLVIVGVTGPITVFSYTVYDIVVPGGTNYFAFMAWIGIWSLLMHWILAFSNSCNALTYVTLFTCDTFGFYVAFIYLQKGIQVLTRQWDLAGEASAYLSVMVSLLVLAFAYGCGVLGEGNLLQRHVRKFIEDYGTPLTIIFFTGFVHIGHMKDVNVETLPTSKALHPTANRDWFVHFWDIGVGEVFLAIPFAVLLTILFWFDHNGKQSSTTPPHNQSTP